MRVVGFNFKKIYIEKFKELINEININTDVQIINIKSSTSNLFKNQNLLNIDYEFKIKYSPDFAELIFLGNVVVLIEEDEGDLFKNILKNWKSHKIEDDLKIHLLNIIFSKCNLKALELEEILNLPFHTPTPRFTNKPPKDELK